MFSASQIFEFYRIIIIKGFDWLILQKGFSLQPHLSTLATREVARASYGRMGQSFRRPAFTEEQLRQYQECTYFTRKEILRLYRRFCSLGAGEVDRHAADTSTRLSFLHIQDMPELRQNPFKVSVTYPPPYLELAFPTFF